MLLVSDRQLTRGQHTYLAGEPFEEPDTVIAFDMVHRGVARLFRPPEIIYQTKVITPEVREVRPEVAAPFRRELGGKLAEGVYSLGDHNDRGEKELFIPASNLPVPDEESQEVAPASDTVLPKSDVSEQRIADRSGRRGRKGHRS
jgi:hypothetical protein